MNSSITECIADKFIYNARLSCNSFIEDTYSIKNQKHIHKSIDYVVTSIKEANDSTRSVIAGNVGSAIINGLIVLSFKKFYDGDIASMPAFLRKISFAFEVGLYTVISTPYFYKQKRKEGLSKLESVYQVARFGVTGGLISFTGYRLAKKEISQVIAAETNIPPEFALPITQLLLTYPFALAVALLRKPMGFATDKTKDYIVETGNKTKDYIVDKHQKLVNGFKNGKPQAKENKSIKNLDNIIDKS